MNYLRFNYTNVYTPSVSLNGKLFIIFEQDYIFPENSIQQDIYEEVFPLIHSLFN